MRNALNDDWKFDGDPSWTETEFEIANYPAPLIWQGMGTDDPMGMGDWFEEMYDPDMDADYLTGRY